MPLPRIGVLVPSTNISVEADFQRVLPGLATLHSERLFMADGVMTAEVLDDMNRDLDLHVRSLASAKVDLIAYACTSGSFYRGPGWDEEVVWRVQDIAGVPCITTSQAVKAALQMVAPGGALSVITPYPDWTNEKLREYYEAAGFSILSIAGDERAARGGHPFINDHDPAEIIAFGTAHTLPEAEALFCSCTAWRTFEALPGLEAATGKPVVASNHATIWRTLEKLGLPWRETAGNNLFGVLGRA